MEVSTVPSPVRAGEPATLILNPVNHHRPTSVTLEQIHEQYLHLLIVSEDLAYFRHEHPQPIGTRYEHMHLFPSGGKYILFMDFTPLGSEQQLSRYELQVEGETRERQPLIVQPTVWQEQGYSLYRSADQPLVSGQMLELTLLAEKSGRPIRDLDYYLEALAHVVIIHENTLDYLHVHPLESSDHGPQIKLHTSFPQAGNYKMFVQSSHLGQVRTASFVLPVN